MSETNGTLFDGVMSREEAKKLHDAKVFREWNEKNKEKRRLYKKEYNERMKEHNSAQYKKWYEENKESKQAYAREWKKNNSSKVKEYFKEWFDVNKDRLNENARNNYRRDSTKISVKNNRRRARKRNAEGTHTKNQIVELLVLQKHKCALCNVSLKKNKYHADHIVPLFLGGSNDIYNIQMLCAPCNLTKQAKDPIEFNQSLGLLL